MSDSKGWQCPACRTHYAPFVDRCRCECLKTADATTQTQPPERKSCPKCGALEPHICQSDIQKLQREQLDRLIGPTLPGRPRYPNY
jgi:hypothetical protein